MPKLNKHHATYVPEWTLNIGYQEHKVLTNIQRTTATEEAYARVIAFQHALSHEANRMRMELDTGLDCKQFFRGPLPSKKLKIKKRKKRAAHKRNRKAKAAGD